MGTDQYRLRRYWLSLSTFSGIVAHASHWWCRIRWYDDGKIQEANAEYGRGYQRTSRFLTESVARSAGLRLVRKLAHDHGFMYYIVTEGDHAVIDPQRTLTAPGNLKARLNKHWRKFEELNGWDGPKEGWPEVQKVCDAWTSFMNQIDGGKNV